MRMNIAARALLAGGVAFYCAAPASPASLGKGKEYGRDEEQAETEFTSPRGVVEHEGRQKDLGKWMKDIEMLQRDKAAPTGRKGDGVRAAARTPGYLGTPKNLPSQPGFLAPQGATEADVDAAITFQDQAMDGIDRELQTARSVAKAGNSISHRADGAVFHTYHGLTMAIKNQKQRDGLGLDTTVSLYSVRYDFSRRLMTQFTRDSVDPQGNRTLQERFDTNYTPESTGLPGHIQRASGYRERVTDIDGRVSIVTRTGGEYQMSNNADYASGMISRYDETSENENGLVTRREFRNGTYDDRGNLTRSLETVTNPFGFKDVTERLESVYVKNPHYINQRLERRRKIDYSRPEFLLTDTIQRAERYAPDGKADYQRYEMTSNRYDDKDRQVGYHRVMTDLAGRLVRVTDFSVKAYDQFGRNTLWRTVDADHSEWHTEDGLLTITDRLLTEYNRTNHETSTQEISRISNGETRVTSEESAYNEKGTRISLRSETHSHIEPSGEFWNQLFSEARNPFEGGLPPAIVGEQAFVTEFGRDLAGKAQTAISLGSRITSAGAGDVVGEAVGRLSRLTREGRWETVAESAVPPSGFTGSGAGGPADALLELLSRLPLFKVREDETRPLEESLGTGTTLPSLPDPSAL